MNLTLGSDVPLAMFSFASALDTYGGIAEGTSKSSFAEANRAGEQGIMM